MKCEGSHLATREELGFTETFARAAADTPEWLAYRVSEEHRGLYTLIGPEGSFPARLSGKLAYDCQRSGAYPAVGDWVMADPPGADPFDERRIHKCLPRKSVFARKAAGTGHETQVVAANADTILLCMALSQDYKLARLERYLTIAWDSGATPLVVLTKFDLCDDVDARLREVESAAPGCAIVVTSNQVPGGYDALAALLKPGETAALLGSSGVGKSTLINALAGEERMATREIRANDGRGRHTTTHRQLIRLDSGAMLIDTPGMRELQLDHGDIAQSFSDIEELAQKCRFHDCKHGNEPGCAVRFAIEEGELSQQRFDSYRKLEAELSYEALDHRQVEAEKIKRMFGGMGEMKQAMRYVKDKNKRR